MKSALWGGLAIATLLVAELLAEQIPLLRDMDAFFADHRGFWVGMTGGMAVVGALLLAGAQFVVRRPTSEELSEEELGEGVRATFAATSHGEAEQIVVGLRRAEAWPFIWWRFLYRLRGRSVGRSFDVEAPMHAVKKAWRRGAWRHHPVWQLFALIALGASLAALGVFGLPIVLPSSPGIKLVCAGALLYATVRTIWAFGRA